MNSLAWNIAQRVFEWFTSANHSRLSSSSSSPRDQIENSSAWKPVLDTFRYYTQASPVAVPLSKRSKRKARRRAKRKTQTKAHKNAARLRAKMVEYEVPIVKDIIDVIQERIQEIHNIVDVDRIELFKKYDYIVIIDASLARSGTAAAVAIVLAIEKFVKQVRIFIGESVTSSEAERIPILHFLQNKRTLIVTDQKPLVSKWESHSKRKGLDETILKEMDLNSESRLMYIPSKQLGLYRMCDIVAGFVARLSWLSDKKWKNELKKISAKLWNMKVDDTFRLLLKKL